jgi:integrase
MAAYNDDGQWRWRKQIRVRGKAERGSGTPAVNTKRAADAAEAEWITRTLAGEPARVGEVPTMRSLEARYLAHMEMHRSPGTAADRKSTLKNHVIPFFGAMRIDQIGVAEIDKFKLAQLEAKVAVGTIQKHVHGVTNLLRWAKERGMLAGDVPTVEALTDPNETDEVEHLEPDELTAVIAKLSGQLRTMVVVAADTGLRIGELLALRWKNVDLKAGRINVCLSMWRGKEGLPKYGKTRIVPLSATARAALKEHLHLRSPYVFCTPGRARGGLPKPLLEQPLAYKTVHTHLLAATGFGGWHIFRHTFGTRLSSLGVPLKAIQAWMGHADISTTMIYAHYSPVLDGAIGALDRGTRQPGANRKTDLQKGE